MASLPQIDSLATPDKAVARSTKKRRFPALNLPFLVIVTLLVSYGLVVVWSAVSNDPDYSFSRQALGVAAGIVVMAAIWRLDYRRLAGMTRIFLIVNVVLILSPHIPGLGTDAGMGAQSWIRLGMQLQPGEFAKITVILLDASVMARYGGKLDNPLEYCKALGIMLVPFLCIMTQPDLGTGLVYLFIAAVALIAGGARLKYLLVTLGLFVAAIVAVFAIDELLKYRTADGSWEYRLLKQYQRNRLLVFMNQNSADMSDEGYNLQQAMIAIGSGGLFGKGLMQSSQGTLGYLPEAPTDFIFCVLAEELGFVGAMALLILYAALIIVCIRIARSCGDLFGMVIVMCVVGMWMFQILENIGMDIGLMPITGIPLPFVSYGSSFMVVNFALLGLIGSVWSHGAASGKKDGYAATH
ncbi:MAG TPA: rod shape-determining protein RodA [Candidatus Aphodovivens excrementavium]|nr:rod shape-determining protein RodA [Candidatus Aphodovivens excrementavium]